VTMSTIDCATSTLLVIDFQTRLMPAIDDGASAVAHARRLIEGATKLDVPILFTEQNPRGLGPTVAELAPDPAHVVAKMTFDASRGTGLLTRLSAGHAVVVAGCEAHVCVLQTVLGLLAAKRRVYVVSDAIGSRRAQNKDAAIRRMERHGAEIVTTEMVLFEWLETAEHPRFREIVALIK